MFLVVAGLGVTCRFLSDRGVGLDVDLDVDIC